MKYGGVSGPKCTQTELAGLSKKPDLLLWFDPVEDCGGDTLLPPPPLIPQTKHSPRVQTAAKTSGTLCKSCGLTPRSSFNQISPQLMATGVGPVLYRSQILGYPCSASTPF